MAFVERFSLDQPSRPSTSFGDRFFGEIPPSSAPIPSVAAASSTTLRRVSAAAPAPRPIVNSRVAQATPKRPSEPGFQLASAFESIVALAYAPNPSAKDSGSALKEFMPKAPNPLGDIDTSRTAIYDITSKTVYLPNGRRMEAHSGLGSYMDDPHYVNMKDTARPHLTSMNSKCASRRSMAIARSGLFQPTTPRCSAATAYWRIPTYWVRTANPMAAFHSRITRLSWTRSSGARSIVSLWSSVSQTRPPRRLRPIGSPTRSRISSGDLEPFMRAAWRCRSSGARVCAPFGARRRTEQRSIPNKLLAEVIAPRTTAVLVNDTSFSLAGVRCTLRVKQS